MLAESEAVFLKGAAGAARLPWGEKLVLPKGMEAAKNGQALGSETMRERRSAEKCDERSPPHSITSSARATRRIGTERLPALRGAWHFWHEADVELAPLCGPEPMLKGAARNKRDAA
jgi:hypothetical protein